MKLYETLASYKKKKKKKDVERECFQSVRETLPGHQAAKFEKRALLLHWPPFWQEPVSACAVAEERLQCDLLSETLLMHHRKGVVIFCS